MPTTTAPARPTARPSARLAARPTAVAGGAYVASWLVGLALAPAAPQPDAPAAEVGAFYAAHGGAVLASSAFVHGTAAVALAVLAVTLVRATRTSGGLARAVVGTGAAAAALSLTQVVLAVLAVTADDAQRRADLFDGLNLVDVLKIALLAGFVAVATTAAARAGAAPRWLRALAGALVPVLVVGSAALVVVNPLLSGVLAVSLVALLAWAGATSVVVARHASPS